MVKCDKIYRTFQKDIETIKHKQWVTKEINERMQNTTPQTKFNTNQIQQKLNTTKTLIRLSG